MAPGLHCKIEREQTEKLHGRDRETFAIEEKPSQGKGNSRIRQTSLSSGQEKLWNEMKLLYLRISKKFFSGLQIFKSTVFFTYYDCITASGSKSHQLLAA